MMASFRIVRWAAFLLVLGMAAPASATEAGKLLHAETEMIVTVNLRQVLDDHEKTEIVRRYLEPCRLALQGDEKQLQKYYQSQEWLKARGITEQEFLDRAKLFKTVSDALGIDIFQDIERVSCGFKNGVAGSWVVVIEGRFQEEKFRTALRQLAKLYPGWLKPVKGGELERWQIGGEEADVHLVLLDAKTLAITGSKKGMDDLLVQAAAKKLALPAGMDQLLDHGGKEHAAFVMKDVAVALQAAVKFLEDAGIEPRDEAGKLIMNQVTTWVRKNGKELAAASVGVSLGQDDLRLQLGLETKKPALAEGIQAVLNQTIFFGSIALRTIDDDLAKQLAGLLLRIRVAGKETVVVIRGQVPYTFIKQALGTSTGLSQTVKEAVVRRLSSIPLWGPVTPQPADALAVDEVRDIAYRSDAKADSYRHRLDVFAPKGKKDCPVVVLVHGGGWIIGDNRCCGLQSSVGHFLASRGFVAVLPNYRLSPSIKHPEHVRDVARAVRWTKNNVAKYGGNPEQLFLMGHSAGGHLVSLLATDESYLKAEGLKSGDIQGVISASGVYNIPAETPAFVAGGPGRLAVRVDQLYPFRGDTGTLPNVPIGLPVQFDPYGPAFGDEPKDRAAASPLTHVRRGLPPFLILIGDNELPTVADQAAEFHQALRAQGCAARLEKIDKRNHTSVMFSVIRPEDPAARAILEFLRGQEKRK
jgi:acetyl esterase/lipase